MARSICTFPGCVRDLHGNGLCKSHRQQQRRGHQVTALAPVGIPKEERFWAKVEKTETCWNWTSTMKPAGYGAILVDGSLKYAHRVSWEWERGPIPEGAVIDHICFNRRCVNPDHLRVTTVKHNVEYRRRGGTPVPQSGIRGVYPIRDKWMARVKHNGVILNLGHFADKEEAGRVAAAKRVELFKFPEFQGEAA